MMKFRSEPEHLAEEPWKQSRFGGIFLFAAFSLNYTSP